MQALSELLGSLKEKSMGGIGRIYIQRKRGGDKKMFWYVPESSFCLDYLRGLMTHSYESNL